MRVASPPQASGPDPEYDEDFDDGSPAAAAAAAGGKRVSGSGSSGGGSKARELRLVFLRHAKVGRASAERRVLPVPY